MPKDHDFRAAGFTPDARNYPRTERQFLMICAFNGIAPESAPDAWRYFPNASTKAAWERVEAVLKSVGEHEP